MRCGAGLLVLAAALPALAQSPLMAEWMPNTAPAGADVKSWRY